MSPNPQSWHTHTHSSERNWPALPQWSDLLLQLRARESSKRAESRAFPAAEGVRSYFPLQHCGGLPAELQ